jgi:hypothetical protein
MTVHGLPVVHDPARVFSNQVWSKFVNSPGTRQGAPFEDRLPKTYQAFISVYF